MKQATFASSKCSKTTAEAERSVRIARIVSEATQLVGDKKVAPFWLNPPGDFLQNESKVTRMKLTDSGACMVESIIRRTAHGFL